MSYTENLRRAEEYQDFIMERLWSEGIVLSPYSSRKYQYEKGESLLGIEIKYDQKLCETGNLYIETAEKAQAENINYRASGIYRNDNTWMWLIGDYSVAYFLSKYQLRKFHAKLGKYVEFGVREVETPTSRGFLLPITYAEKFMVLRKFIFPKERVYV